MKAYAVFRYIKGMTTLAQCLLFPFVCGLEKPCTVDIPKFGISSFAGSHSAYVNGYENWEVGVLRHNAA